ncbi:MAG: tRNA adenosine(34) deaminase TadA [Clostridiales bacterium]|jgi:tRNA(adenine34) deaminase|nr:tRNA adenosine(34) deaminase TadA [Clostridiales bacterium]
MQEIDYETYKYFMDYALSLALKAFEIDEVPVGCIIVKNNSIIIGEGFNSRNKNQNVLSHAEIIAIDQACKNLKSWRLENCDIYTTIEPCAMCAGAILQARVNKLIFGAKNKKFGCAGSVINFLENNNFNHEIKILSGVKERECEDIIKKFFLDLRTKNKSKKTGVMNEINN